MSRRELGRFAVVGAAAYGTDVAVFNALRLAGTAPVGAKTLSSVLAVAVTCAGSRWWTWPDRVGAGLVRQSVLFVLFSARTAGLQLLSLVVSREVLGLRDAVSDNVSANVVGMALATAFRFWTFRTFVFAPDASGRNALRPAGGGTAPPPRGAARSRPQRGAEGTHTTSRRSTDVQAGTLLELQRPPLGRWRQLVVSRRPRVAPASRG